VSVFLQAKEEITKLADAVYELFETADRGAVITYEQIDAHVRSKPELGVESFTRNDPRFYYVMRQKIYNRLLRERDIVYRVAKNVGYELLTTDEQVLWCPKNRQKRAYNQIRRGVREVRAVDPNAVKDERARGLQHYSIGAMVAQRQSMRKSIEVLNRGVPHEPLPKFKRR
jgi:hypothetical protein